MDLWRKRGRSEEGGARVAQKLLDGFLKPFRKGRRLGVHDVRQPSEKDGPTEASHAGGPQHGLPGQKAVATLTLAAPKDADSLGEDAIRATFSGAPQFRVRTIHGQLVPTVLFPFDKDKTRDVCDSRPIDSAFSCCTAQHHLASGLAREGLQEYDVGVSELPCMLSAQGQERGTVGFEHYLQQEISDANVEKQELNDALDDEIDVLENLTLFRKQPEKLGLRRFNLDIIGQRLEELVTFYQEFRTSVRKIHILKKQSSNELYTFLFSQILFPPRFSSSSSDPTGLEVQVKCLVDVLKLESLWFDFSLPAWRLRVGEILWGNLYGNTTDDDNDDGVLVSDREILILQITLSCELLLRLDALSAMNGRESLRNLTISDETIEAFRKLQTRKTRWDLILARTFLRNVDVEVATDETPKSQKPQRTFFSLGQSTTPDAPPTTTPDISFRPQHLERQLAGLFRFAHSISWPEATAVEASLRAKLARCGNDLDSLPTHSVYGTPPTSPPSGAAAAAVAHRASGYFDARLALSRRPTREAGAPLLHAPTAAAAASTTAGWLTRTFLTGLVLPGDAALRLLMATLLENDAASLAALLGSRGGGDGGGGGSGGGASLRGGFARGGRTWWSSGCSAVARALAPLDGAAEEARWVALPLAPVGEEEEGEGWLDVAPAAEAPRRRRGGGAERPRIERAAEVEADGAVVAGKVRREDLVVPLQEDRSETGDVRLDGLFLLAAPPVEEPSGGGAEEQGERAAEGRAAAVRFSRRDGGQERGGRAPPVTLPLAFLVSFVSAFPCFPPADAPRGGHPLLRSVRLRVVRSVDLLSDTSLPGADIAPGEPAATMLVVDARGEAVLDVLARAWCSSIGLDAVVGRSGVTCLACCVREARAAEIGVVIRVG